MRGTGAGQGDGLFCPTALYLQCAVRRSRKRGERLNLSERRVRSKDEQRRLRVRKELGVYTKVEPGKKKPAEQGVASPVSWNHVG